MSMLLSFCLSQFASYMVADEENRASRFQGLRIKIQMFLIPQQLKTYSQALIIAREVERGLGKKRQNEMQRKSVKRPFQLKGGEDSVGPLDPPLAEQLLQPLPQQMRCGYCLKLGHYKRDCRMENKVCLACGCDGHMIMDCSFRWIGSTTPIQPTLLVPSVRRDP